LAKLSVVDCGDYNEIFFFCPACECSHAYFVNKDGTETNTPPRWTFNGDWEKPTFTPSLLLNKSDPKRMCHLYVTEGKIRYCADSPHRLAGQTVDMVEDE